MKYAIAFHERALAEYEASVLWYSERSLLAAENFVAAVDNVINDLRTRPAQFRKSYKEFREVKLRKYPFNVIYFINEERQKVIISSIYHHKRNPKIKYRKLK